MTEESSPHSNGQNLEIPGQNGIRFGVDFAAQRFPLYLINLICLDSVGESVSEISANGTYREMRPRGSWLENYRKSIARQLSNGFVKLTLNLFDRLEFDPQKLELSLFNYFVADRDRYYLLPTQTLNRGFDQQLFERIEKYARIDVRHLLLSLWAAGCSSVPVYDEYTWRAVKPVQINLIDYSSGYIKSVIEDNRFADILTYTCECIIFEEVPIYPNGLI